MAYIRSSPCIMLMVLGIKMVMVAAQNGWIDANWKDLPFMVQQRKNGRFNCGGSILTLDGHNGKGAILTAAHCIDGLSNSAVTIYIGCTTTDCSTDSKTTHNVESIKIHPSYTGTTQQGANFAENDIAIIYLTNPITQSGAIPVILESDPLLAANNNAVKLTGYYGSCAPLGSSCQGGSDTDSLEYAISHIMTRSECDDIFGAAVTTKNDFCIKDDISSDGTATICNGDSGSPVFFDGKQIGINSFGRTGCNPGNPQVATYIPSYYKWILSECGINCVRDGYLGCYKDTASRALRYGPKQYGYNIETCKTACNGYKYFGLQDNGWCSCENDYFHSTKYGITNTCPSDKMGGPLGNDLFVHPGYQYKGCYKDTADRAFRYGPKQYGYYPATCRIACKNYKYFALQDNGWCSCENDWNSVIKHGVATNCPTNRMGAALANDVFENIGYYQLLGCYRDTSSRALRYGPQQYGYTPVSCRIACNQYKYFALQDNGWCSCENDYNHAIKYGTSSACNNDMGGPLANSLYLNLQSNLVIVADINIPIINIPDGSWKIEFNTFIVLFGVIMILIVILCYINCKIYEKKQNKEKIVYKTVDINSTIEDEQEEYV